MATSDTLAAARNAATRAGLGTVVTASAGNVEVLYPRGTTRGRVQRLGDALRVEGLDPHPTVNGLNDGFAVEAR